MVMQSITRPPPGFLMSALHMKNLYRFLALVFGLTLTGMADPLPERTAAAGVAVAVNLKAQPVSLRDVRLLNNRPGKFWDAVYPIPPELTRGKGKIVVKLQARPGNFAGGLFGCGTLVAEQSSNQ